MYEGLFPNLNHLSLAAHVLTLYFGHDIMPPASWFLIDQACPASSTSIE